MNQTLDPTLLPLRDIHLPAPVGWWPPAPGWWLVVGLVLMAALVGWLRHAGARRHRAAVRALDEVVARLNNGADPKTAMQQVSEVLRRFAMTVSSDTEVAGLTGDDWLAYLDSRWDRGAFSEGVGRRLLDAPYTRQDESGLEEALALSRLCRDWVKHQPRGR